MTLKTIMRSIANGEFKKVKNGPIDHRVAVDGDDQDEMQGEHGPVATATTDISPEQVADSRSQLEFVESLVADDEDCWLLMQLWAERRRGKEAAEELGWDAKHYDAVRNRLLRRLEPAENLRKTI